MFPFATFIETRGLEHCCESHGTFLQTQYFFKPEIFLDPKFFGPESFLTQNFVGPKIFLGPKFVCTQKFV